MANIQINHVATWIALYKRHALVRTVREINQSIWRTLCRQCSGDGQYLRAHVIRAPRSVHWLSCALVSFSPALCSWFPVYGVTTCSWEQLWLRCQEARCAWNSWCLPSTCYFGWVWINTDQLRHHIVCVCICIKGRERKRRTFMCVSGLL